MGLSVNAKHVKGKRTQLKEQDRDRMELKQDHALRFWSSSLPRLPGARRMIQALKYPMIHPACPCDNLIMAPGKLLYVKNTFFYCYDGLYMSLMCQYNVCKSDGDLGSFPINRVLLLKALHYSWQLI